jgi:hypothetical protein
MERGGKKNTPNMQGKLEKQKEEKRKAHKRKKIIPLCKLISSYLNPHKRNT